MPGIFLRNTMSVPGVLPAEISRQTKERFAAAMQAAARELITELGITNSHTYKMEVIVDAGNPPKFFGRVTVTQLRQSTYHFDSDGRVLREE